MASKSKAYGRNGWVILSRWGASDLGEFHGKAIGKYEGGRSLWLVYDERGRFIGRKKRQKDAINFLFNHVKRQMMARVMESTRRFMP